MIPDLFYNIVQTLFGIIVFFVISPQLMVLALPLFIGILASELILGPKMRAKHHKVRAEWTKLVSQITVALNGIRTTIGCGMEQKEIDSFKKKQEFIKSMNVEKYKFRFIRNLSYSGLLSLYYDTIMVGGTILVLMGKIPIGDMFLFYMYSHMVTNPIVNIGAVARNLNDQIVQMNRLFSVLDTEVSIKNSDNPIITEKIIGEICFNDVSFKYKDTEEVLKHINLKINAGEYLAIVGESGSGKSTLAGLIPRYYDINSGSITIDGINIKDLDLHTLRRAVGFVQQDPFLYDGTILDNIKYGVENATMDEVIDAAKKANAHDFISKLKDGYQSTIGERGVKLSGGQRQRIAIARLFLMNPPIMIFDEATSSLDNKSEKEVQKALDALAKHRTTIVIAHRLSTIQNADRIILLSEDGIVEEGNHKSLMSMNGTYAQLYSVNS